MIMLKSLEYLELTYRVIQYLRSEGGRKAMRPISQRAHTLELAVSEWLANRDMESRSCLRSAVYDMVETAVSAERIEPVLAEVDQILGLHLPEPAESAGQPAREHAATA